MLVLLVTAGLFAGSVKQSAAHSDPRGDTHPQVSVVDGKFAITFNSTSPKREDYSDLKPVQREIYNADGTLFAPRHLLERKRDWRESGPAGLYGKKLVMGEASLTFPGDQRRHPYYYLTEPGAKPRRIRLPWPASVNLTLMEDVYATSAGIAITGKEGGEEKAAPLKFYWFAFEETQSPTILEIGQTACIYDFPVASNLAFAAGRFWLAYMKPNDEELKLALWSWKPGEKEARVEILDSPAFWNSHLSLAAIGERLCLAYHCVPPDAGPEQISRIISVFRKAE